MTIHIVLYLNKAKNYDFAPNYYNGSPRHTTMSDAEHSCRKWAKVYPDSKVITFKNLAQANEWLMRRNSPDNRDF